MTSHILFITYYLLKSYLQIIINSLKKTISSKHYLQFLLLKKNT